MDRSKLDKPWENNERCKNVKQIKNYGRERWWWEVGGGVEKNINYAYFREIFVICCFLFKLEHFTGNMYVGKLVDVYYFDKSLPKSLL